jgi:hypothetical protein
MFFTLLDVVEERLPQRLADGRYWPLLVIALLSLAGLVAVYFYRRRQQKKS